VNVGVGLDLINLFYLLGLQVILEIFAVIQ